MRRHLPCLAAALAVLLAAPLAQALAGRDRTRASMWRLTEQAVTIAVVQADGSSVVRAAEPSEQGNYVAVEHVRVLEVIKGPRIRRLVLSEQEFRWTDMVKARYSAPRPLEPLTGRAPELVFLGPAVRGVAYREPLFGGRIEARDERELAVFREWIAEAVTLQAQHRPALVPSAVKRAWLVRGAARGATRGYARQELVLSSLTAAERQVVLQGFTQEPTTDRSFYDLLLLAGDEPHEGFDRAAIGVMDALLDPARRPSSPHPEGLPAHFRTDGPPLWTVFALPALMRRLKLSPEEQARITGRSDGSIFPTRANVEAAWSALRAHRRVPAALPVSPFSSLGADSFQSDALQ